MATDGSLSLRERRNAAAGVSNIFLQGLVDRGAQHFRDREYRAALRCLDDAIEQDSDAPLAVIDKRAATHIKLNDLGSAQSDAGRILRRDKTNAIGYLRLGQILQLQKTPEKAVRVYEKALRSVSSQDAHFKTLQHSHNKLVALLAPRTASDPLKQLPREIATMLFENLSFRDLVNMSRACRSWRTFLIQDSSIWTRLDFSTAGKTPSFSTVKAYVKRSNCKVELFATSRSSIDQKPSLFYVADRCKRLRELYYNMNPAGGSLLQATRALPNLRKLVTSGTTDITADDSCNILSHCRQLEHVEFQRVLDIHSLDESNDPQMEDLPNLRVLTMNARTGILYSGAFGILQRAKYVRRLSLRNWKFVLQNFFDNGGFTQFDDLQFLDVSGSTFDQMLVFPPAIQDIIMTDTRAVPAPFTSIMQQNHPNLRRLSLGQNRCFENTIDTLHKWLSPNEGDLVSLDLNQLSLYKEQLLGYIAAGYLQSIETLSLRQCPVNDDTAESLARHCKRIRSLDLAHTAVTGVGVKALVLGIRPTLVYLGLDSCKHVSPDAIEWARKQGLQVSFNFPEHSMQGKKVRSE